MEFRLSSAIFMALCCTLLLLSQPATSAPVKTFVAVVPLDACGQFGQKCCDNSTCNAGLFCDANSANTCQYNCGGIGQYCCSNSPSGGCNEPNLFCQQGIGTEAGTNFCIENCGNSGQKCCRNNWCAGGLYCDGNLDCKPCNGTNCPSGTQACGNPGQTCCANNTCVAGTFCDTTSEPGKKTCRPYCGAAGQRCCPVKSAGYDGCTSGQGIFCDDAAANGGAGGTGLCTYNCGFLNQQCCGRGWCSDGLNCVQAKCVKQATCGGANQACCAAPDKDCITGYFCFQGMCRQNCGLPGQSCCIYDKDWCQSGRCRPDKVCE